MVVYNWMQMVDSVILVRTKQRQHNPWVITVRNKLNIIKQFISDINVCYVFQTPHKVCMNFSVNPSEKILLF